MQKKEKLQLVGEDMFQMGSNFVSSMPVSILYDFEVSSIISHSTSLQPAIIPVASLKWQRPNKWIFFSYIPQDKCIQTIPAKKNQ